MFVMLYFMHLKFEGRWKFVLLAPTIILAMALVAALIPDVGEHYYDVLTPQSMQHAADEAKHAHAAASAHGAPHDAESAHPKPSHAAPLPTP
jgi:cytochrome c oxidase subunit 4